MAVEDAARAEPRVAVGAEVLLALGVDLPHVALHGAPLLVGLVANEAEVVPARQHPHRGGHQGAPIGGSMRPDSDIYKKCRGTTFKRAECGKARKLTQVNLQATQQPLEDKEKQTDNSAQQTPN